LIGVQNNSTSSVSSTPVQGAGITGFDGDGLCASSITPHPAGCPYGSTGYEGRGSTTSTASTAAGGGDSFTVIDANHAIVNFSPAIPPGGSAYFSLEGPATSISRPTTVTLSPLTAINPVSTNHTVTATVKDQNGALMGGWTCHFTSKGRARTLVPS